MGGRLNTNMKIYHSIYKIRENTYEIFIEQKISTEKTNFGHPVRIYIVKAYCNTNLYIFQYSEHLREMLDVYINECNRIVSIQNTYNAYPCHGCERESERCKCNIYKDWVKTMWGEICETFNRQNN